MLADDLFTKALWSLKTWLLVNSVCGKLALSIELPIMSDERFKVTWVPFLFLISIH